MSSDNCIVKIALTGGPCAGKTSALADLQQHLQENGFTVILVPESATIAISAGFKPGRNIDPFEFQKLVAKTIANLEDSFIEAAKAISPQKIVLICDRGMMDGKAYMREDDFQKLLIENHQDVVSWRDARYDAVIHMRTAALGAPNFYTLANNAARTETPQQAIDLDEKTLQAWVGHPHLRVIDNSTNFADKLLRVRQEIFQVIGIPIPIEIERKFLIKPISITDIPVHFVKVDIEQIYLISIRPNEETRVRRRGQDGSYTYYRTIKKNVGDGIRTESEEQIDKREYDYSLKYRLPNSRVIKKERICFLWLDQYFELDKFSDPADLWLLEVELTSRHNAINIPPFIDVIKEVTDDPAYKNATLATN